MKTKSLLPWCAKHKETASSGCKLFKNKRHEEHCVGCNISTEWAQRVEKEMRASENYGPLRQAGLAPVSTGRGKRWFVSVEHASRICDEERQLRESANGCPQCQKTRGKGKERGEVTESGADSGKG